MRHSLRSAAVLLSLTSALPVLADVIEPDDFAPGTNISTLFPGATLSTVNSESGNPDVFATVPALANWASTGTRVFGHVAPYGEHWVVTADPGFRFGALQVKFEPLAAVEVTIDFIANDVADVGQLLVYSPAGTLLQTQQTNPLTPAHPMETLVVKDLGEIGSIIAGGAAADTVCLDHITWLVPEPAAVAALVVFALLQRPRR